jgi:hypothetical protein
VCTKAILVSSLIINAELGDKSYDLNKYCKGKSVGSSIQLFVSRVNTVDRTFPLSGDRLRTPFEGGELITTLIDTEENRDGVEEYEATS